VAQKGYQLKINTIEKGISETGLQYQLSAAGDFDGIEHGWLAASCQQSYPQILHLSADGCNLEPHLPYPTNPLCPTGVPGTGKQAPAGLILTDCRGEHSRSN
jgi:hypothetical protein